MSDLHEEYEFYREKFQEDQAIDNEFNDRYGFPRKDLALIHVLTRARERQAISNTMLSMYHEALLNRAH